CSGVNIAGKGSGSGGRGAGRILGGTVSYDLSVWYCSRPLKPEEAGPFHVALCEGRRDGLESSPRVRRFVDELTARYPQIDDVPEEQVDECPWTIAFDQSEGHVIMCIARSR